MRSLCKWAAGLLAALLVLVALAAVALHTFDWNRLKPRIVEAVETATGRSFEIGGDLAVAWDRAGTPGGWRAYLPRANINAEHVRLGRPAWAGRADLLQARRLAFSVDLLPLLRRHVAIHELTLEGADLALERPDTARNNWTFARAPDDPGTNHHSGWTFTLDDVRLIDAHLTYIDVPRALTLEAWIESVTPEPTPEGLHALPYAAAIRFKGQYRETKLEGSGKSGAFVSLRDPAVRYPLQVRMTAGQVQLAAEGRIGNLRETVEVDLNVEVKGDSMALLFPLTGIVLPDTPPFATDGHLRGSLVPDRAHWRYEDFHGTVGRSDLHGSLDYQSGTPRPRLRGELTSRLLHLADLGPLIGVSPDPRAQRGRTRSNRAGKILPTHEFRTDRWSAIDLDLKFEGERIIRPDALPLSDIRTHAVLENGELRLDPLQFGIAGGDLNARLRMNGRARPAEVVLHARMQDLRLPALFPTIDAMQQSAGKIDGAISILSNGNSVAQLLGRSQGEVKLYLQSGRISRFVLEAASLNIASAVIARLFGDKKVKIECAAAELAVRDGLATARNVRIGTTEALIDITGAIDFHDERLALDIRPETYDLRVLSLRAPLYIDGSFADPRIGVEKGSLLLRAGAVALIAAVAPAALALLPVTVPGSSDGVDCAKLLANARRAPQLHPDTARPIESPSVRHTEPPRTAATGSKPPEPHSSLRQRSAR